MAGKALVKKQTTLKQLKEKIDSAKVLVFSNYSGFSVKEITGLRKKLRKQEAELKVYKNTLFFRAMKEAGFADIQEFAGPTAVLLGYKDPVAPLKILVDAIKEYEKGEIKIGVIEKTMMGKEEILKVAKLPSREVLLAKVIGGLQSPLYGLVNVLNGTARKLIYALNAVAEKKGGEQK
ncbi:MAG: 50S ribosomal protein L10 [Candidatus Margulisbacteria bacterium]|nr:50S ribosomal protein L10 [Candidatus Margulisiibacteriota bacterium]